MNLHKVKVVEGDHGHPEDGGDDYFFKFLEDESFTYSKLSASWNGLPKPKLLHVEN